MHIASSIALVSCIAASAAAQTSPRASNHVRYLGLDISSEPHMYAFNGWENRTGGRVEKVFRDIPSLMGEVNRDINVENYFDVYQVWVPVFDYVARGQLADLTDKVLEERYGFRWLDIMLSARNWLTEVQGRVYSVPVDADPLVLYYRRDLIDEPPTTWEGLIETARRFHGQDLNGDGEPDYGTCIITEGQFPMYLYTIANTVYRYGDSKREHYLFDAPRDDASLESMLGTEGYAYALDVLKQLYQVSQGWGLSSGFGPTNAYATWKTGRCATFISFPSAGSWVAESSDSPYYIGPTPCCTFMRGKQGTTRTPGSRVVFDRTTRRLTNCTSGLCKHQEFGGVNRPTYVAGAVQLFINAKSPVLDAAVDFAAYFSANVDVRKPGALNPFRSGQMDPAWFEQNQPVSWVAEDARQYTSALYDTMTATTTASSPRFPGAAALDGLLEAAMKEYIGFGNTTSPRTAQQILDQVWADAIVAWNDQGFSLNAVEDFFRTDVGLPPRAFDDDSKPFPPWAIVIIVVVVLAAVVGAGFKAKQVLALSAAPKDPAEPVAIVFVTIQGLSSTSHSETEERLVELYIGEMRREASKHGVYEVKRVGESTMFATASPEKAAKFALAVQKFALTHVELVRKDRASTAAGARVHRDMSDSTSQRSARSNRSHRSQASQRSHRSQRSSAHDARTERTGARNLASVGMHYGLVKITHDEVRAAYDYAGTTVEGAAIVTDKARGGQIIATEELLDAVDTPSVKQAARGNVSLSDKREHAVFFVFDDDVKKPSRSAFEDTEDGAGAALAALNQASGQLTRKRVVVVALNVKRVMHNFASNSADTDSAAIDECVFHAAAHYRGTVVSSGGGRYIVAFNAFSGCLEPLGNAARFMADLKLDLTNDQAASMCAGVARGLALCGMRGEGTDATSAYPQHHVLLGPVVEQAGALCDVAPLYSPHMLFLSSSTLADELHSLAHIAWLDIVKLPIAADSAGLVGVLALRDDDGGANDEWMYVLLSGQGSPFSDVNAAFAQLLAGRRDLAEQRLALRAPAEGGDVTAAPPDAPMYARLVELLNSPGDAVATSSFGPAWDARVAAAAFGVPRVAGAADVTKPEHAAAAPVTLHE